MNWNMAAGHCTVDDWQTCFEYLWFTVIHLLLPVWLQILDCLKYLYSKYIKHFNPRCNFHFNRPAYNHDHPRFFKIRQCLLTLLRQKFQQISTGTKIRPQPFKRHPSQVLLGLVSWPFPKIAERSRAHKTQGKNNGKRWCGMILVSQNWGPPAEMVH